MSAKTHTTALVLIPPEEIWGPIQEIRRRYDRQFRRWMPHVTLLYPFRPRSDFEALGPELEAAAKNLRPAPIELATFRYFQHGRSNFTLWLDPEPGPPIVEIQSRLGRNFPDCDDVARHPGGFHPHLSVGQFRGPKSALLTLLGELQESWLRLECTLRDIALIWRGDPPDDVFRAYRRFPLDAPD